jgi:hypothetical protein
MDRISGSVAVQSFVPVLLCPVILFLAPASFFAPAQTQREEPGMTATTMVVEPVKKLRKSVDGWPLLVNPGNDAGRRVNATLTRLNERLTKALRDCDANSLAWAKQSGNDGSQITDNWSRNVAITMHGPRFLSFVASEEMFCGGAHPDEDQIALVFDMTTGQPVNWMASIAKSEGVSVLTDSVADGSNVGAVIVPALRAMSVAAASTDCKDAFQDPQSYLLWPDAKKERLVAQPFDLPHAVMACSDEIDLTMEQARKLGFNETLLNAITEAHRQITATSAP